MVDTAGKKLKQARQRKQLSLEEAARATKIRVPRLVDIENDDYTNFPSMAYVRGFLVIYSRYLGIDVSEYTESLGSTATSVGIGDYEYLSNAPERTAPVSHRKVKRSFWPLLLLGILLGIGVCAAVIFNFVMNAQRLGNRERLEELGQKHFTEKHSPASGDLDEDRQVEVRKGTVPEAAAVAAASPTPSTPSTPIPAPLEVRRAEAAHPEAQSSPIAAIAVAPGVNEVVVKAVKKTWVQIFKDDPGSPAVYEDWLYPDTFPLKLRGARFYIKMSDSTGLQVTKNGVTQPISQPEITIQ